MLATILNAKPGSLTALAGIVCSSWTVINMATSGRTTCTPLGREDREYVALANLMAARSHGYNCGSYLGLVVIFGDRKNAQS